MKGIYLLLIIIYLAHLETYESGTNIFEFSVLVNYGVKGGPFSQILI